jgi:hypothetical protein
MSFRIFRRLSLVVIAIALVALTGSANRFQSVLPEHALTKGEVKDEELVPLIQQSKKLTPDPGKTEEIKPIAQPVPNDGIVLARVDLETVSIIDRYYTRYIWIPDGEKDSIRASSLTLNYISRATIPIRPMPVAGGRLLRIDLRHYAPREKDLEEWITHWEEFQFDPHFSLLITKDIVDFVKIDKKDLPKHKVTRTVPGKIIKREETRIIDHPGGDFHYPDDSGRILKNVEAGRYKCYLEFHIREKDMTEEVLVSKNVDVIRLNGKHILSNAYLELQQNTGSLAPVVHHLYFMSRVLATIKDKGPYRTILGGLYYEFRGIKKAKDVKGKEKATDEDLFFEELGVGNIAQGITAKKVFDKLRSDQRAAVFRSNVTGKPRRVDMFHTLAGRETTGWGSITHDLKDEDIDIGTHPIMNLIDFKDAAREAIFESQNGLHIFALFDANGGLQDEAPIAVVADRTIPAPHSPKLQAAISCIRCHGISGDDGWKPVNNDVKILLNKQLDVFRDTTRKNELITDTVDRLVGLYGGNFSKNLTRARDDYAESILKVTGPWSSSLDQTDVVKISSQRIANSWAEYNYNTVDAHQALKELGVLVPKDKAADVINRLLIPDKDDIIDGIIPEDPRIGALKRGLSINRTDWSLVYSFAAARSQKTLALMLKGTKK